MSSLNLSIDSLDAKRLQDVVQREIARRGWSEGEEDAVMSEYVLVMVANKKTQQQIGSELKDLLGEEQDLEAGVESFVSWLWQEASNILGSDIKPQIQREKNVVDMKFRSRRSASPENRASGSRYEDKRSIAPNHDRHQSDRWQADQNGKPTRDLFASNTDPDSGISVGGMASDRMDEVEIGQEDQRSLRIAGRGRMDKQNNMFKRSLEQAHRSNGGQSSQPSIFARAGVPNPRADEFVPASNSPTQANDSHQNLLLRIDPMMPNNAAAPDQKSEVNSTPTDFPTQPLDSALCRWGLKCTSPTCIYSHPSPSAVILSRQTGEDPLVLRQEPCHYQKDCTRADCDFSHISPAVKFVLAKADRAASMALGSLDQKYTLDSAMNSDANNNDPSSIPCRYGSACYRQDCHFSHPDKKTNHVSERLKRFANTEPEGEMEIIIPTA